MPQVTKKKRVKPAKPRPNFPLTPNPNGQWSKKVKGRVFYFAMLDAANPQLRAMILLGVNCGMGNSDVASLPIARLDLDRGWHHYERPKTQVDRRAPLWPELGPFASAANVAVNFFGEQPIQNNPGLFFVSTSWAVLRVSQPRIGSRRQRHSGQGDHCGGGRRSVVLVERRRDLAC